MILIDITGVVIPLSLGRKLKKAREMAKMSLRKVAEKTRISYSYLSNIENGRRKNPSMEVLRTLAKLYNVDITYFIDDSSGYNPQTEEEKEIRECKG